MKEVLEGLKEEKHLFEPKKAFAKDAEGSVDLRDQRRKDASEASKYPLSQGETDNHWKSIDTKPFKVQDIELAAIQESHLKPLGNLQANQSFSSVAQENSTTKKLNYEVKVPKRFIKQKNQESKTENGLQLEANPHMDGQQTPSDNLIASSVPEGEKSSKPAEPVTPKPKTPLARNAIHRMTTMWGQDLKKTTVYPPEPELVNRPSGMGNRSGSVTLGNSENTTKLLEAYQVMRQNAEVEDEFQVWRVNLLAIIDEFVLITGVKSPEDLFKEEEDLSLAQRICRCLKGKSKAPSPPLKA